MAFRQVARLPQAFEVSWGDEFDVLPWTEDRTEDIARFLLGTGTQAFADVQECAAGTLEAAMRYVTRAREYVKDKLKGDEVGYEASSLVYDRRTRELIAACLCCGSSVYHLEVHPAYRRQGIATNMLKRALTVHALHGSPEFDLWRHDDSPGARLYERLGFRATGQVEPPPGAWRMNDFHEANRSGWDAAAKAGVADFRCDVDWRECHRNPRLILDERELKWLGGLRGKKACVLGSGDNRVAFALAGLGAEVTSVDISEGQLDIARQRAAQLGLVVRFLRADVTDLSAVEDGTFDLVYTGGHVAVWVSDLRRYYAEATRILRPGGLFLINEYHPFRRIWCEKAPHLTVRSNYFDLGPDRYDRAEGIPGAAPGSLPAYEFHWTVSQYLMAVLDAGCELLAVDEFGDQPEAHEEGPSLAGLPQCLLIVARKAARRRAPAGPAQPQ